VEASLADFEDPGFRADPASVKHAQDAIVHLEAAGRAPGRQPDAAVLLLLGRLHVVLGEPGKAIPVLEGLLQQEPGLLDAIALLADCYQKTGRPADAVSLLAAAAASDPRLYLSLADLYEQQRQWNEAAKAYEQAAARFPMNAGLKTRWAMTLLNLPDGSGARRARDVLAPVVKDNPSDSRALYLFARAQRALHDLDGAETSARRLMELRPTSTWGPEILAQVFEDRREFARVIGLLQPLLTGDAAGQASMAPNEAATLLVHLGFAYLEVGQPDRAVATFQLAASRSPEDLALKLYLAQAELEAGHPARAIELIREIRRDGAADPRLVRIEAEALRRAGKLEEGADLLKQGIAADPGDPERYLALAELYMSGERYSAAVDLLSDAQKRFPDDLTLLFQQGAALERAKRFDEAEQAFRRVIAKDPLHAMALNYLGYMLADRGVHLDEAIDLIKRALAVDPQNGSYLDSLGWAYFRQKRFDLAEGLLKTAAEQRERDSAIQDHYGDVLEELGRHADAVRAWERALAGDGDEIDRPAIQKKIKLATEKIKRP